MGLFQKTADEVLEAQLKRNRKAELKALKLERKEKAKALKQIRQNLGAVYDETVCALGEVARKDEKGAKYLVSDFYKPLENTNKTLDYMIEQLDGFCFDKKNRNEVLDSIDCDALKQMAEETSMDNYDDIAGLVASVPSDVRNKDKLRQFYGCIDQIKKIESENRDALVKQEYAMAGDAFIVSTAGSACLIGASLVAEAVSGPYEAGVALVGGAVNLVGAAPSLKKMRKLEQEPRNEGLFPECSEC